MKRETRTFYALIGLWVVMFLFLNVIPMIYSFYLALTNFDGMTAPRFIAFKNYLELLQDYRFLDSLGHTLKFTFFNIIATITVSFLLATLLNKNLKGKGFFRSVLFDFSANFARRISFVRVYLSFLLNSNKIIYILQNIISGNE